MNLLGKIDKYKSHALNTDGLSGSYVYMGQSHSGIDEYAAVSRVFGLIKPDQFIGAQQVERTAAVCINHLFRHIVFRLPGQNGVFRVLVAQFGAVTGGFGGHFPVSLLPCAA